MAVLMPKLSGEDIGSFKKWAEEVIALFERDALDTAGTDDGTGGAPIGSMVMWLADTGSDSDLMTGPSAPAPNVATASSTFDANYPAWEAFDGVVGSGTNGWVSLDPAPQWINRKWTATPQTWNSYTLVSFPNSAVTPHLYAPKDWELWGSNDNWATHTVIDTRADVSDWLPTGSEQKTFLMGAPGSFEDYRFHWLTNNGGSGGQIELADIRFHSSPAPPDGWLWADGSVISQDAYGALYAVVGDKWNDGSEGAGNFRLPDATDTIDGVNVRRIIRAE